MPLSTASAGSPDAFSAVYEAWEALFAEWLRGATTTSLQVPERPISSISLTQKLYYLPLAGIFLSRSKLPTEDLEPIFSSLSAKIITLIDHRFQEESGLLFLMDASESPLPDADFWSKDPKKIADPAFLALTLLALENLIQLGGRLDKDIQTLSQYYELLTYSCNEHLWNEEYGIYFPYDLEQKEQILSNGIGGLLFWIADVPDQEQAEAMYRTLANNFVHPRHYYFPTRCVLEGAEQREVDLLINYLLFFGLTRFDFGSTAQALRQHTQYLVEDNGVQIHYDSNRHPEETTKREAPSNFLQALWADMQGAALVHSSNRE